METGTFADDSWLAGVIKSHEFNSVMTFDDLLVYYTVFTHKIDAEIGQIAFDMLKIGKEINESRKQPSSNETPRSNVSAPVPQK